MKLSHEVAAEAVREANRLASRDEVDADWVHRLRQLSEACELAKVKTHIAFIGTALVAKATTLDVDVYAVKEKSEDGRGYSARALCEKVLVPESAGLGFDIGVTGREPLNNQPYFYIRRVDDPVRLHRRAIEPFEVVKRLIGLLEKVATREAALKALAAYVLVRREYQRTYAEFSPASVASAGDLAAMIQEFVGAKSEGGRRAQAVVAGLIDTYAGAKRVMVGRVNDPSRRFPGDVAIMGRGRRKPVARVFEVRDKRATLGDALNFCQRCIDKSVKDGGLVLVGSGQEALDRDVISVWAKERGASMTVFEGWREIVEQVMFWCGRPITECLREATGHIAKRLQQAEVDEATLLEWSDALVKGELVRPAV